MLLAQKCVLIFYTLCIKCVTFTWKLTHARLYQEAMQSKNCTHWAFCRMPPWSLFPWDWAGSSTCELLGMGVCSFPPHHVDTLRCHPLWDVSVRPRTAHHRARGQRREPPDPSLRVLSPFSRVQLFETVRTSAHRAPLSMGSPGKNTGEGCQALPARDLPNSGIETS